KGTTGYQGPTGATGRTGNTGPQGQKGQKGEPGNTADSCQWTPWSPWSIGRCSRTCGNRTRLDTRTRRYTHCVSGAATERRTMACFIKPCTYCEWSNWGPWVIFERCNPISCHKPAHRERIELSKTSGSSTKCAGSSIETKGVNCDDSRYCYKK
ncbi:unnamed protein product, partial [Owenia fusiformis]